MFFRLENIFFVSLLVVALQCFSVKCFAYDPCKVKHTQSHYAKSICYDVKQNLDSSYEEDSFNLRTVLLTKDLSNYKAKDTVVLIPGGPGSDSQSIAMGFNDKGLLNAFWAHLDLNVVLYDPRSTGASVFLKDAQYYPQEVFANSLQVNDLKKVIDRVSADKPVYLLAHSAGGNVAAKLAALYPEKVKGLIMFSASVDNRQIGESNLRLFAKDYEYFGDNLQTILSDSDFDKYKIKLNYIENFLMNAVKLIRISGVRHVELRDLYIRKFRNDLILSIENDLINNTDAASKALIVSWYNEINSLPKNIKNDVDSQAGLRFTQEVHEPPILRRSNWIKTVNICGEGITKSEITKAMWLDGITLQEDICYTVQAKYNQPPSRDWLKKIKTKTLLIGGQKDTRQIPSEVFKNSKLIKNSEVLMIKDAGHEAFKTHSHLIYKTLEEFFKN